IVRNILLSAGKSILISFKDCQVTYKEKILFDPSWGTFDMAVGAGISSVFAGAADPNAYYEWSAIEETYRIEEKVVQEWNELEKLYKDIRSLREGPEWNEQSWSHLNKVISTLDKQYPNEWLLRLEILELYKMHNSTHPNVKRISDLLMNKNWEKSVKQVIQRGFTLINNS
ncbi:MAG: phenylalanine 4-monooxygenase, partial [Bacillus sp. (in: firmicutes)]